MEENAIAEKATKEEEKEEKKEETKEDINNEIIKVVYDEDNSSLNLGGDK